MEMDAHRKGAACSRFEASLEDYLSENGGSSGSAEIEAHLRDCSKCSDAFAAARVGNQFLRAGLPLLDKGPAPRPEFARNVMARIRMDKDLQATERSSFWQPFVSVAWRFAATAALALVLLLTYAARGRNSIQQRAATIGQAPLADVFAPDPTRVPADQDEILIMVAETDHSNGND